MLAPIHIVVVFDVLVGRVWIPPELVAESFVLCHTTCSSTIVTRNSTRLLSALPPSVRPSSNQPHCNNGRRPSFNFGPLTAMMLILLQSRGVDLNVVLAVYRQTTSRLSFCVIPPHPISTSNDIKPPACWKNHMQCWPPGCFFFCFSWLVWNVAFGWLKIGFVIQGDARD